jgi:hypothetical protein
VTEYFTKITFLKNTYYFTNQAKKQAGFLPDRGENVGEIPLFADGSLFLKKCII